MVKLRDTEPVRLRLGYIDGMRGLAAFYVMLSHSLGFAITDYNGGVIPSLSRPFLLATRGLMYGHYAVAVFIVLSGFCLMLPVAHGRDHALAGGLGGFARRRARRILPPYYAALVLAIAIAFAARLVNKHPDEHSADISLPNVLSHLILVHNLFLAYHSSLDAPMWSVAAEWQIYILFALILLPAWRSFGTICACMLAFVMGFLPAILLPAKSNLHWTSPWYLGLFSLGMAAAVVMCGRRDQYRLFRDALLQNIALGICSVATIALFLIWPRSLERLGWQRVDIFVGAFTAICIVAFASSSNRNPLLSMAVRGLESRPMMALGAFSYSLYLIHFLLLSKLHFVLHRFRVSPYADFACLLLVGVPVCLLAAYAFHLVFERPFMPGHPRTERQAEMAAIASPAP